MNTLSAIPIKAPYIDQILSGEKTWEIRSKNTKKLGQVALIRSASGTVVATAVISEVVKITYDLAKSNAHLMGMSINDALTCIDYYAWVLTDVVKFKTPVPYIHPSGAVTWVTLRDKTVSEVLAESKRSR